MAPFCKPQCSHVCFTILLASLGQWDTSKVIKSQHGMQGTTPGHNSMDATPSDTPIVPQQYLCVWVKRVSPCERMPTLFCRGLSCGWVTLSACHSAATAPQIFL
jgi:hypothetical protein